MSGGDSLSLPGVLLLSQVEVLHLAGGEEAGCAALCRGKCLRWDWRQASHSCILDHRQDLRGLSQQEEETVRKTTERRAKPKRKTSKPGRRTTKRTARTTTARTTTATTTTATSEKSQRKTAGKRKPAQRKPLHSSKGKTLIEGEEITRAEEEAKEE